MNHLNLFNPFTDRPSTHEDVLTRNFLILLKNIPLVQVGFFELIRDTMSPLGITIDSCARGTLKLSEIHTQVSDKNPMFEHLSDVNVLSVLISDDSWQPDHTVTQSDRAARYDGVVICDPSWVFIIENKPSVADVWEGQLDPNFQNRSDIHLIEKPCKLSWRDVISLLNELLLGDSLVPFERTAISEFIEYMDENYPELNPYDKFALCKSNKYLLDRKCCAVMASYGDGAEVTYRKGWKYYIETGKTSIQNIALDSEVVNENEWKIHLWMYAGVTMKSAKEAYRTLDVDQLFDLPNKDPHYQLSTNFQFAFQASGIKGAKPSCPSPCERYIRYWKEKGPGLKQLNRKNDPGEFESYFWSLVTDGIVDDAYFPTFKEHILDKNYSTLNVCPGFLIKYTWDSKQALELDSKGEFEQDFKEKVNAIFGVFKE